MLDLPACDVAVERGVKETAAAAAICTNTVERDVLIFLKISARERSSPSKIEIGFGVNKS